MTTLADLQTSLAIDLRDTGNATWNTSELTRLINKGTDALADFYPKEIVQTLGTIAAGVNSYAASSFTSISRVDIYTSEGSYRTEMARAHGDGANSGWELHAGALHIPPSVAWTDGDTLRAFGYGRYIQLSASTQTTDVPAEGLWAVHTFAVGEAYRRLIANRVAFQQWQTNSNNTDARLLDIASVAGQMTQEWRREQQRLRRLRK